MKDCIHIKPDGARCGSPAMRGRDHCYFHRPEYASHKPYTRRTHIKVLQVRHTANLEIGNLRTPEALQNALRDLLECIADGTIDAKQASLMSWALQMAQTNLKNCTPQK